MSLLSGFFFFFFSGEFTARVPSTRRNENPRANAYKNLSFLYFLVSIWVCKHTLPHMWLLNLLELFSVADFLLNVIFSPVIQSWKLEVFCIILDNLFVTSHCRAHKSTPNPSLCRWAEQKPREMKETVQGRPAPGWPNGTLNPKVSKCVLAGLSAPSLYILWTRTLKEMWRREWEKWMRHWENKSSEIPLVMSTELHPTEELKIHVNHSSSSKRN